jgi:hypothetical protein
MIQIQAGLSRCSLAFWMVFQMPCRFLHKPLADFKVPSIAGNGIMKSLPFW